MTIGTGLHPVDTGNAADTAGEASKRADDAGVESVWFGQRFGYDAISLATVAGTRGPAELGRRLRRGDLRAPPCPGRQPATERPGGGPRTVPPRSCARARSLVDGRSGSDTNVPWPAWSSSSKPCETTRPGTADLHGGLITAPPTAVDDGARRSPAARRHHGPTGAGEVAGKLADGTLPFLAGPRALAEHIARPSPLRRATPARLAPRFVAPIARWSLMTRTRRFVAMGGRSQVPSLLRSVADRCRAGAARRAWYLGPRLLACAGDSWTLSVARRGRRRSSPWV
jgi:hypothetical protein